MTQRELADVAGVTENAVSKWENGYAEPRMGAVEKMADHFGLTKFHLIEEGGMGYVDPLTKRAVVPADIPIAAIKPLRDETAYAPLRGRVHAGSPREPETVDEFIAVPGTIYDAHPNGYFLEVEGDCMDRVYPEGCFIFIDPDKEPKNGSIAAVKIDGCDYVMRRLYRGANTMVLSPDSTNPAHEDIVIGAGDELCVELVGTVVWFQASREMA